MKIKMVKNKKSMTEIKLSLQHIKLNFPKAFLIQMHVWSDVLDNGSTVSDSFCLTAEEISSDEDEVNESQNVRHQQSSLKAGHGGDDDDDNDDDNDDYWDEDAFEGTRLEEYSTPLDYDNGEDEYQFFTSALLSKL